MWKDIPIILIFKSSSSLPKIMTDLLQSKSALKVFWKTCTLYSKFFEITYLNTACRLFHILENQVQFDLVTHLRSNINMYIFVNNNVSWPMATETWRQAFIAMWNIFQWKSFVYSWFY